MTCSRKTKIAITVAAVLALSACGSSSDDDDSIGEVPTQDDPIADTPDVAETPDAELPPTVADTPDTPIGLINPELFTAPADVPGGPFLLNSNNSAILTGPVFGSAVRPNSSLVNSLAFIIEEAASGLEVIEIRAIDETSAIGMATRIIGILRNSSDRFDCLLRVNDVDISSPSGVELGGNSRFVSIEGVAGAASDDVRDVFSSACIGPGDLAYFTTSVAPVTFENVAQVSIEEIDISVFSEFVQSDELLMPLSYTVNEDGTVVLTVVNGHSEPLDISGVRAFALDENGHAISFDIYDRFGDDVEPGQEIVTDDLFGRFEGQASSIRVIVDYDFPLDE